MIASYRDCYIFINVNKATGTSFEIALSRDCGPDDIITALSAEDENCFDKLLGHRGAQHQTSSALALSVARCQAADSLSEAGRLLQPHQRPSGTALCGGAHLDRLPHVLFEQTHGTVLLRCIVIGIRATLTGRLSAPASMRESVS